MNAPHYYVESSKPNKCLFCGLGPDTPHLANIAPPSPCPDCLALAKVMLQYFGQVDNTNRCLGEGVTYDLLKAFVKEREP